MKSWMLLLALAAAGARAAEPKTDEWKPNLNAGNFQIGMNAALHADSFGNGQSQFSVSGDLGLQYFVVDHLSLGGIVQGSRTSVSVAGQTQSTNSFAIGPELTWYLWTYGRFTFYVEPELFLELRPDGPPTTFGAAGAAGGYWFFTPSVAFGPGVRYFHRFGNGAEPDSDQFLLYLAFSLYL
jgi:hypothetical protein